MGKIIGIDLGTKTSCAAVMGSTGPRILGSADGSNTIPSYVAFLPNGQTLVGTDAQRQAVTNPEFTFYATKRLIGRSYADPTIATWKTFLPYEIVRHNNGDAWVSGRDRFHAPPELAAHLLKSLKERAEQELGEAVTGAVIAIPACYDDGQRQATLAAAEIAGLSVVRLINEPTAASLAYGISRSGNETIAIFDFGGSTFDLSIIEMGDGVYEIRSTAGDNALGGEDIDNALVKYLCEEFKSKSRIDVSGDKIALQRLKEAAEQAKKELSTKQTCDIHLPFLGKDHGTGRAVDLKLSVSRQRLESLASDLVQRTLEPCRRALKDAGLKTSDIRDVLLVGGMTRMPLVQKTVRDFFGREPRKGVNPDEAVALGAAVQAGVLTGDVKNVVLLDVTPYSLGIETLGGVFTRLVERNTTIPTKKSQIFSTAEDNQNAITVRFFQGEREMAADNRPLGQFDLMGIPSAPRGMPQIEVVVDIDANGVVSVKATDKATKKEQSMKVTPSGGLSKSEIERLAKELASPPKKQTTTSPQPTAAAPTQARTSTKSSSSARPSAGLKSKSKIFLSYRRSDTEMIAGRIYDRLEQAFGKDNVFYDVDAIPFGVDFRKYINSAMSECHSLLSLIGRDWLGKTLDGHRIQQANDFVRAELGAALANEVRIIPVLIGGAPMPDPDLVPESIRSFCYLNAAHVAVSADFDAHMARVIRALNTPN